LGEAVSLESLKRKTIEIVETQIQKKT